ncbi:hypothetical protein EYF80_028892 [Liparis tanakae]|uniref:Uncharacterized protein n=1 Tax=Liparis tanakae TaxID=230148 RepID=A0A4Z2H4V9_9TELE|nr:hypothetical protein EYF80_028892 [Liparis tanakae]
MLSGQDRPDPPGPARSTGTGPIHGDRPDPPGPARSTGTGRLRGGLVGGAWSLYQIVGLAHVL